MRYETKDSVLGAMPGQIVNVDNATMDELDRQQGRKRVPAAVCDALIGVAAGVSLIDTNMAAIERHARDTGAWGLVRSAAGMIRKAFAQMVGRVSVRQQISMENNTRNVYVTVSAMPVKQCVNVRYDDYERVCMAALHLCSDCAMDANRARRCQLRPLLDQVDNVQKLSGGMDGSVCPYFAADVDWESVKR